MNFIDEKLIEAAASELGNESDFSKIVAGFKDNQPVLLAYLFSENLNLLTQQEREYMMFLALVIWKASYDVHPELDPIGQHLIEEREENNWDVLNSCKSRIFKERIDSFFVDYPQEDLLAFVEDSLIHDEDSEITKEGKEYIFVALKTIIDCLHEQEA